MLELLLKNSFDKGAMPVPSNETLPDQIVEIGVLDAWNISTGSGIVVGLLDTGVSAHNELEGKIVDRIDFSGEDSPGIDNHGHGTAAAGIVSAALNGVGVVGAAHCSKILDAKVADGRGRVTVSGLIQGIEWAISSGAQVLVTGIGSGADIPELREALLNAVNSNVVCCAVGSRSLTFPAAYDFVLSFCDQSLRNEAHPSNDAMVPVGYWSVLSRDGGYRSHFGYPEAVGASVVALVRSAHPRLNSVETQERIIRTARKLPNHNVPQLDALAAVAQKQTPDLTISRRN